MARDDRRRDDQDRPPASGLHRPGAAPLPGLLTSGDRAVGYDLPEAYRVLDLALRAGEVLLSGGAGASDVTATVMGIAHACGLPHVECDVTFTSISVSWQPEPDVPPVTSLRLVRQRSFDYSRVTEVHNLVEDLIEGRIDRPTATERLLWVRAARHPYGSWTVTFFRALLAGSVTVLLGAGPIVLGAAFAATVLIDRANLLLGQRNVPLFYQNVLGAAIATGVAIGLVAAEVGVRPSLVVAGGIILLLPGVTLVGAVQDAITGFLVTSAARAVEAFLLTAGIISGVALALSIGERIGVPVQIVDPRPTGLDLIPLQVVAAAVVSAAFAVANYAPRRTIPFAGAAGAIGWGAFAAVDQIGLSSALSTGAAAVVLGMGAYAFAHRQHAPALLYVASGVIPLLPGLTIYRGMFQLSNGQTLGGIATLGEALSIGLALAAGAILGQFIAQPSHTDVDRYERRLVGPRLAGPLRWRRHK